MGRCSLNRMDGWTLWGCLRALRRAFKAQGGTLRSTSAQHLERSSAGGNGRWRVVTADGDSLRVDAVVICSALGSAPLLEPLGHPRPMEAVLGQVLELKRQDSQASWEHWPAVLTCGGINLIPPRRAAAVAGSHRGTR